jgi:hypothetical protein
MGCHSAINPLGFSLENFDAIGRWRTEENHKPVNAASNYETEDGETIRIQGARDIAEFAAQSEDAHRAFITHLFHHLIKQPAAAYDPNTLASLRESFAKGNFNIKNLTVQIATRAAMHKSPPPKSDS